MLRLLLCFLSLFFLLPLSLSRSSTAAAAASNNENKNKPRDLVRSSCARASYPSVCLRTLSSYKGPADTPRDLAQAAVKVSLSRASRVSVYLSQQVSSSSTVGGGEKGGKNKNKKRERVALSDCVEQISDSVEELRKTLNELKHLNKKGGGGGETFSWQMSNAETWVSAALTDEDTCLDGFEDVGSESEVKVDVKKKITDVARVTSNALYMITRLDDESLKP